MNGCAINTVATDALVLKHQAIGTHSVDQRIIMLKWLKILHLQWTALEIKIMFKRYPLVWWLDW